LYESGRIWKTVASVREQGPLVHNITNYVSMDVAANALLAFGASPAMVHAQEEVEEFVGISSALVINIGTLSPPWVKAMVKAADRAVELGRLWVLDPVGAGATSYRTAVARDLSRRNPAVVRGNASEVLALAGEAAATKGVDSVHASEHALDVARTLARELGCVVAVTGAVDYVTDGARVAAIENGHAMMTKVTALGCAASAMVAACLAVEPDPVVATTHALAALGVCGEIAAEGAPGPGTLRLRLIDALYALDEAMLGRARVRDAGPRAG
jgi:hydroxyethylthiazole kinase